MLTVADLTDPSAVITLKAEADARGACHEASEYLADCIRLGWTLEQTIDGCAYTRERQTWTRWAWKNLPDRMDTDLRRKFLEVTVTGEPIIAMGLQYGVDAEDSHLVVRQWHSRIKGGERRPNLERRV